MAMVLVLKIRFIDPHSLAPYLIFACIGIKRHHSFCTDADGGSTASMTWCYGVVKLDLDDSIHCVEQD